MSSRPKVGGLDAGASEACERVFVPLQGPGGGAPVFAVLVEAHALGGGSAEPAPHATPKGSEHGNSRPGQIQDCRATADAACI